MAYLVDDIINFLKEQLNVERVEANSDIYKDLEANGDEFLEMIAEYSKKFNVDMENYNWYFHSDEEGVFSIGALFFKPPYKRVERIPVTPLMLTEFANKKKWDLQYPPHHIPARRVDLIINRALAFLTLGAMVVFALVKCG
jgi:hypothetical protein